MILCTDFLFFSRRVRYSISPSFLVSMKHEIKGLKINDGQMMPNRLPICCRATVLDRAHTSVADSILVPATPSSIFFLHKVCKKNYYTKLPAGAAFII